jgi:hypothetical protein
MHRDAGVYKSARRPTLSLPETASGVTTLAFGPWRCCSENVGAQFVWPTRRSPVSPMGAAVAASKPHAENQHQNQR